MGMTFTKFDEPMFTKTNYAPWKLKMNVVLVKDDYAVEIRGKENKPKEIGDLDFEKKNKLVVADIIPSLDDFVLFSMIDQTTAKSLWYKLENL